jgi:putative membrane protein
MRLRMNVSLHKNLYQKFIAKELELNDQLAAARSILANERTFLSYQRTGLALLAGGFSFIQFFGSAWIEIVGYIFIPSAVITFALGILRYIKMRDLIRNLEMETYDKHQERNKEKTIDP